MSYDNTNTGALFKNERKAHEKQPDYNGNCNVNGQEFFMSAWLKKSKAGKTYMSFAFSPKAEVDEARKQLGPDAQPQQPAFDDDIPF